MSRMGRDGGRPLMGWEKGRGAIGMGERGEYTRLTNGGLGVGGGVGTWEDG